MTSFRSYYERALDSSLIPAYVSSFTQGLGEMLDLRTLVVVSLLALLGIRIVLKAFGKRKNLPPAIPGGLPLLGNLLQLKEGKPHALFTKWAQEHGPIFRVKIGSTNTVVIASSLLAKEIMVTKYTSVSSKRSMTALDIITRRKMVVMLPSGDEHRRLKKLQVGNLLSPNVQREKRSIREKARAVMLDNIFEAVKGKESATIEIRQHLVHALFTISFEQVFGRVPDTLYVPELGRDVDKSELWKLLVGDLVKNVGRKDWRNFFPALSWLPNKALEDSVREVERTKTSVIEALIALHRKEIASRGPTRCYADICISEASYLDPERLHIAVWEPIMGTDSMSVTAEWVLYNVAQHHDIQDRLYEEIKSKMGDRMVTEDDLDQFPLLNAIVLETLRVYPPVPIIPPRYGLEDVTVGGYDIPKGFDVVVNAHAIHMDSKVWTNPEKWEPDRLLFDDAVDFGIRDFRILPFGAGKRVCPGILQVVPNVRMILAMLVQHFRWDAVPVQSDEAVVVKSHHKIETQHEVKIVARPRLAHRMDISS